MELWMKYLENILMGIIVCAPLVVSLIKYVRLALEAGNWNKIVKIVLEQMVEAEANFSEGVARKVWVLSQVRQIAQSIGYTYTEVEEKKVAEMIDAICDASHYINVEVEHTEGE